MSVTSTSIVLFNAFVVKKSVTLNSFVSFTTAGPKCGHNENLHIY